MASNSVVILAIDGGGIRGIIPAFILNQIEIELNKPCFRLFDIIGGTSTGAILTAGLTTPNPSDTVNRLPYSAQTMLDIYVNDGAQIFVKQSGLDPMEATYYSSNGNQGIEPFLQTNLGAKLRLSDAMSITQGQPGARIKQMFTTGCIVNSGGGVVAHPVTGKDEGAYLFNWYDAARNGTPDNYYVWEAARSSSAAPSYFPIAHVGGGLSGRSSAAEKWVIDGGVMSNNPAMWAIAEAFRMGLAQTLSDITIVSIGTGFYPGAGGVGIHNNAGWGFPDNGNWSLAPWMAPDMYDLQGQQNSGTLVNIILDAVQNVAAQQLQLMQYGGLNYFRLEPNIPYSLSQMDNITPTNIANLQKAAANYIKPGGAGYTLFGQVLNALV